MEKCVTLSKWGIQRVNPGAVASRLDAKIIVAATTTVHIQSRRSVGKEFVTSPVNSATTSFPQPEIRPAGCGFLKRKLVGAGGLNSESEWHGDVSQSQITERRRADASIRGGGSLVRNCIWSESLANGQIPQWPRSPPTRSVRRRASRYPGSDAEFSRPTSQTASRL